MQVCYVKCTEVCHLKHCVNKKSWTRCKCFCLRCGCGKDFQNKILLTSMSLLTCQYFWWDSHLIWRKCFQRILSVYGADIILVQSAQRQKQQESRNKGCRFDFQTHDFSLCSPCQNISLDINQGSLGISAETVAPCSRQEDGRGQ